LFTVLTDVTQLVMEFWTSVAVGGVAGLRTRGTAALIAAGVAVGALLEVLIVDVAARTVLAKSAQINVESCIVKIGFDEDN
jgi:hypothetical protein